MIFATNDVSRKPQSTVESDLARAATGRKCLRSRVPNSLPPLSSQWSKK